jgi:hypothetical protein
MTYDDRLLKADHINLQDGIIYDADGMPLAVGEDTKMPLGALGPVGEYEVPEDLNDEPCVDSDVVEFWRNAQRRAPKDAH